VGPHPYVRIVAAAALFLLIGAEASASSSGKSRFDLARLARPTTALRMGRLTLPPCEHLPAYCGTLDRPLDPAGETPGTISIHFELYPRRDPSSPALEPIVAAEGGPGYPTVGSRVSYIDLFWPLMDRRDLLLVDNRGTGSSQAIVCPSIQTTPFLYPAGVRACGERLGDASDLYGSGLAADDLAAVLDALGIGRIHLYGDSYGTFFSQTFAGRHPDRLRSLVLDGAYPVVGQSPWYQESATALRRAIESVCAQSASCPNLPGETLGRLTALLDELRARPFEGDARDGNGDVQHVTADASHIAFLAFSNASGPVVYRELDAAARADLDDGDPAPLLRLLAENYTASQSGGPPYRPGDYSAGLFTAVSCSDYPFVYDLTKPAAAREAERDASFDLARTVTPDLYSPFTIDEYDSMPLDYSVLDTCLSWPVPSLAHPPGQPVPPGTVFPSCPVLVLSGSLDSLTPAEQGEKTAALFPDARQILVANSFHVTALGEQDHCASEIVRRFVRKFAIWAVLASVVYLAWWIVDGANLGRSWTEGGHKGSFWLAVDTVVAVDTPNLVVDTIKLAEREDAIVLRLYEAHGARGHAHLSLGVDATSVVAANLLEDETGDVQFDGSVIELDYRPFEIITLILRR
jgi:pimeloyl-ACP methyl ester carboxylesterase